MLPRLGPEWPDYQPLFRLSALRTLLLEALRTFADEHVLHWFACLSAFGELESGLKSLAMAVEAISVSVQCSEIL